MANVKIPTFDAFMNPILFALTELGGSGTVEEINSRVTEIARLTDSQLEVIHDPQKGTQTEVEYRIAWARTYLEKYGVLENSSRGVWALTADGREIDSIDPAIVKRSVRDNYRVNINETPIEATEAELSWRSELMETVLKLDPAAFERLAQRLLRESGFTQVEVIGRTGDGGIDGKGIMRLGGLLSFHVLFQCKRYRGAVSASQVRDFRGALVGRADKGLLITTGNFTKDAVKEATRDGAQAIELIDGDQLLDRLKDLSLGVKTEKIELEKVTVDTDWFSRI